MKSLVSYSNDAVEYSCNVNTLKMGISEEEVMFITVTRLTNYQDYTVVFNGLPTTKLLKKAFGQDAEAAHFFLKALKEDAVQEAIAYWHFDKDEWLNELDAAFKPFLKGISRRGK